MTQSQLLVGNVISTLNEPQVQKVISVDCGWLILMRLVCVACQKMNGKRCLLRTLH